MLIIQGEWFDVYDLEVQPGRRKNEFQAICNPIDQYSYGGHPIFTL